MQSFLARLASLTYRNAFIFALVVAALFYFTLYDDGSAIDKKITEIEGQISTEEGKTKQSEAAIREVELIRNSIGALEEQFKVAAQQLPSEIPMAEILKSIDTLAKSSGVSIKSKEPGAGKKEDILEMIPLHINMQGSFSEITMFLYYISSMERISRIQNFTLNSPDLNTGKYTSNSLQFDGEIVSYRFVSDEQKPSEKKE